MMYDSASDFAVFMSFQITLLRSLSIFSWQYLQRTLASVVLILFVY